MVSNKFRYQLRQEADLWLAEELIDTEQYKQLAQRYHFQTQDKAARDHFAAILIGLGNILIGFAQLRRQYDSHSRKNRIEDRQAYHSIYEYPSLGQIHPLPFAEECLQCFAGN